VVVLLPLQQVWVYLWCAPLNAGTSASCFTQTQWIKRCLQKCALERQHHGQVGMYLLIHQLGQAMLLYASKEIIYAILSKIQEAFT